MDSSSSSKQPTFTLEKIGDKGPESNIVIMLGYGGAGEGKTWFLGTGGNRIAIIDTGNTQLPTLNSKLFREKVNAKPLVLSITETERDANGFLIATAFDKLCDAIDWLLATKKDEFDILAINDTTYTNRFAMNKGLEAGLAFGKSMTLAKQRSAKLTDEVIDYGVQDFGMAMNLIEKFIAGTISLCHQHNKHFIMMAHERLTLLAPRDDKGKPIIGAEYVLKETRPAFIGKTFPDNITGFFDVIWHFESVGSDDSIVYRARTRGSEEPYLIARTNYGGLFPTIVTNPNLKQMIECIRSNKPHPDYKGR